MLFLVMEAFSHFLRAHRRFCVSPAFLCTVLLIPGFVGCNVKNNGSFEPPKKEVRESAGANRQGSQPIAKAPRQFRLQPKKETPPRQEETEVQRLEVILNPNLSMDEVPETMREIVSEMARMLPGQNLIVVAYAPSKPPRRIGTAHLDAASGEMTFKWDIEREEPLSDGTLLRVKY
jgi:hypothetical protein